MFITKSPKFKKWYNSIEIRDVFTKYGKLVDFDVRFQLTRNLSGVNDTIILRAHKLRFYLIFELIYLIFEIRSDTTSRFQQEKRLEFIGFFVTFIIINVMKLEYRNTFLLEEYFASI